MEFRPEAMWTTAVLILAVVSQWAAAKVFEPCLATPECGHANEFCAEGHCQCKDGHLLFDGICEPSRSHGEPCDDGKQIQCTFSGDPNLQCKKVTDTDMHLCVCRRGFVYDEADDACVTSGKHSASRDHHRPDHVRLAPPSVSHHGQHVVRIDQSVNDEYRSSAAATSKSSKTTTTLIVGPVAVVCSVLVIFGVCLCFWSARMPSLQDHYGSEENDPDFFDVEGGDPQNAKKNRTAATTTGTKTGEDNPCYQCDVNADALSHHTTQTEVCDASHAEYLSKHEETSESVNMSGVKLLFMHGKQPASLTASMDEADAEVAGIYKTFSSTTAPGLVARLDSASNTPPPPALTQQQPDNVVGQRKTPHVIELIETPECTSIDTNIPQEEIDAFEKAVTRKRMIQKILHDSVEDNLDRVVGNEKVAMDLGDTDGDGHDDDGQAAIQSISSDVMKKEENCDVDDQAGLELHFGASTEEQGNFCPKPDEEPVPVPEPAIPLDGALEVTKTKADVDVKTCSDYVDEVFKPVFSIA